MLNDFVRVKLIFENNSSILLLKKNIEYFNIINIKENYKFETREFKFGAFKLEPRREYFKHEKNCEGFSIVFNLDNFNYDKKILKDNVKIVKAQNIIAIELENENEESDLIELPWKINKKDDLINDAMNYYIDEENNKIKILVNEREEN